MDGLSERHLVGGGSGFTQQKSEPVLCAPYCCVHSTAMCTVLLCVDGDVKGVQGVVLSPPCELEQTC